MKSKILFLFLAAACIFSNFSCQSQARASDDAAIKMLKEFYTSYITEGAKIESSEETLASIKKKYCTGKLLNKMKQEMEAGDMDSDPFINAQDFDIEWLKTLSISKDPQKTDVYIVSYLDNDAKTRTSMKLHVVKAGAQYKIDAFL
ncbi:MAG TPA: DUF3828 domain-containing protein [Chitinophaga sp.]